jgi:hypothetical protein
MDKVKLLKFLEKVFLSVENFLDYAEKVLTSILKGLAFTITGMVIYQVFINLAFAYRGGSPAIVENSFLFNAITDPVVLTVVFLSVCFLLTSWALLDTLSERVTNWITSKYKGKHNEQME